jgi:transposase InsO family protein
MGKQDKRLEKNYYDIRGIGSYGGVHPLSRQSKLKPDDVKQWLQSQDAYTLHKPVRYKFPRRKVIVAGPGQQWQADLVDVGKISRYNRGIKFLLTCIDVFSKRAWVRPLKDKTGASLVAAFDSINEPLPRSLQTDKGKEFVNQKLQQWLKQRNVHFFTSENDDIKAGMVERFNRTLKSKLWRYFTKHDTLAYMDVLDSIVDVYNHTPHRSIGMAPEDVSSKNKSRVWFRLYGDPIPYKEPSLKVGDSVRISKTRRAFKKGYLPQWTEEIFTITERKNTRPITFVLSDYDGEQLKGTFYGQELQKVTKQNDVYKIEKILKQTKTKVLVKWKGYPDKFNSWVATKDLR